MWAEKLPSGHYRFTERYVDPVTGESKRVSVTMEKNTAQTRKLATEILRSKMYTPAPSSLTLSQLIDLYNADQAENVKPSTCHRNAGILDRILRVLGDIQVDKLTAGYIRKQFMESGKSHTTLNEYLTRFKALMRWAYKYDYIPDIRFLDKLDRLSEPPESEKVQDKFLEASELSALLDGMDNELWHDVTEFLALSGLRFGECAALLRSDVDIATREIYVTKTYDPVNDVVTRPKTFRSERTVYMQDELFALCMAILKRSKVINISNQFFPYPSGYISYAAYLKYLHAVSLETIGRTISPHTLRHTHASLLMEQGIDIETISARLGHSDSRVTKEIYAHITQRLKEQRNERIKNIKIIG